MLKTINYNVNKRKKKGRESTGICKTCKKSFIKMTTGVYCIDCKPIR